MNASLTCISLNFSKTGFYPMTDYLASRDDAALDLLIARMENAEHLTAQQSDLLAEAKRILAERSASKVAPFFDMPRAIAYLSRVARDRKLCSYRDLVAACVSDPDLGWSKAYRRLTGPCGLMQSIIRHCDSQGLPQLACLVVREAEVGPGPYVAPNRDGEADYGFKRGMVAEGLERRGGRYRLNGSAEQAGLFRLGHQRAKGII
ncbi:MAG: hypothetical protein KDK28_16590 [Maritimibacter sp.]|nr:hypothetical protein [Maritimibacter sp.]